MRFSVYEIFIIFFLAKQQLRLSQSQQPVNYQRYMSVHIMVDSHISRTYRCINNRPCETLPYLTHRNDYLFAPESVCSDCYTSFFSVVFSAVKKCDCSPGYNTADMSRLRIFLKHWISMAKCHKTNNMRPTSLPRHARPDQAKLSRPFIHRDCKRRREYRHIIMCHLR